MRKATLVMIAGAVCGAAATYLLAGTRPTATTAGETSFLSTLTSLASRGTARGAEVVDVTARLAAYRSAAAHDEPAAIEAALERTARAERTAARDLEIDALLARLGELDAAGAARTAQRLALDARFVADAWLTWAEQDADAALAALAALGASTRHAAALALLDVVGYALPTIERVAAALPPTERGSFEVDALTYKAERDPYGAFRDSIALPDSGTRQRAAQEVAIVWGRIDPEEAFAEAALAPADLRQSLQQSVSTEWARLDSGGFIRSLRTLDVNAAGGGIQLALTSDPEGVIEAMEGMESPIAASLRSVAMSSLAQVDVEAAKARAAVMPPGQERDQAVQNVASAYARVDPEAALAWAESFGAPTAAIQRAIMVGIASSGDIERALRVFEGASTGTDAELLLALVASRAAQDPREARKLANDLAGKGDAQSKALLARLVSSWAQREPDGALEWLLPRVAAIDPATIGNVARTVAARDATAAAAYTDRLPPQLRSVWLAQVAGTYARSDPAGAMRWLDRYQGQEGYDIALRQMATQTAQTDPRTAAAMLERASADVQLGAAQNVASSWARTEPAAAARWAVTLTDPRARTSAVTAAVSTWAAADLAGAETWALSLSAGASRDEVLTMLLPRRAAAGEPLEGRVLASFSNAEARQNAIVRVFPTLRLRNPAEARRVLDAYVTDPTQRQRLEEQLSSSAAPQQPGIVTDSNGNVIFLR